MDFEQGFIDILKQLVAEQVNAVLSDTKQFKSVLADYTRNEYKKESRFLIQAVEAGVAKAIKETDNLPACKRGKINELVEDYGLSPEVSAAIVDTLALVLRGDTSKSATATPAVEKPAASKHAPVKESASNKVVEKADASPLSSNRIEENEVPSDVLMEIEDFFTISGRGTVVTGKIQNGSIVLNEKVTVVGDNFNKQTVITGIEMSGKLLDEAKKGDNVGILLRGIQKEEIKRGYYLEKATPLSEPQKQSSSKESSIPSNFTGKGKKSYGDLGFYEGDFVNGRRTGKGKYTWPDGTVYEGDWVNDERTGKGKQTWPDGTVYEGDWVNSGKNGKGKQTWPNGFIYEGDWVNNEYHGKGRKTHPNGDVDEGNWKHGKFKGKGLFGK